MSVDNASNNLNDWVDRLSISLAIFEQRDHQFCLLRANPHFCKMPIQDSLKTDYALGQIFDPVQTSLLDNLMAKVLQEGEPDEVEIAIESEDEVHWWRMLATPVESPEKAPQVMLSCIDITAKKRLELNRERMLSRMGQMVDSAYDGMLIFDSELRIEYSNSAAENMFGYAEGEMSLLELDCLIPERFRERHKDYVKSFSESPKRAKLMEERAPVTGLRKDGSETPVEITISKMEMDGKKLLMAVVRDTAQREKMMDELRRAAFEDPLTGIYNRRHMSRILHRELQRVHRFDRNFSIMMLDLDHFKQVNDTYGHAIGDELLMAFVAKVKQVTRSVDVFGRWGGEEFILLLPETKAEDAVTAAESIRKNLRASESNGDDLYGLTASYGIAEVSSKDKTIEAILERADGAMYQAKSDGRDCIRCR